MIRIICPKASNLVHKALVRCAGSCYVGLQTTSKVKPMTSKYPKIKLSSILVPSLVAVGEWTEIVGAGPVHSYSNGEDILTLQLAHSQGGSGAVIVYAPVDDRIPTIYRVPYPCHFWNDEKIQGFEDVINASIEKVISSEGVVHSRSSFGEMRNLIATASLDKRTDSLEYLFDLVSLAFSGDRRKELDSAVHDALLSHPAYSGGKVMVTEEQIRTMNIVQLERIRYRLNGDTELEALVRECHQAAVEEIESCLSSVGQGFRYFKLLVIGWLASFDCMEDVEKLRPYFDELRKAGAEIDIVVAYGGLMAIADYTAISPGSLTGGVEILPIESVPPKLPEEKLAEVKFVKAAYTADELAQYAKVAIAPDADEELCGYNWQCCEFDAFILIIGLMLKHGGTFDESAYVGGQDFADAVQVFNDIKEFHDK